MKPSTVMTLFLKAAAFLIIGSGLLMIINFKLQTMILPVDKVDVFQVIHALELGIVGFLLALFSPWLGRMFTLGMKD